MLHLAAEVGGIGANRANPGRYWYANLMMGAHVLEQSRLHGVDKLVVLGCARTRDSPVPFREDDLWNGYPENERTVRRREEVAARRRADLPRAVRAGIPLPVNLYGPGDNFDLETSHVIPGGSGDARGRRAASARSCSGVTARRRASSSTSRTAPTGSRWRRSATTGASRLGTGEEIGSRSSPRRRRGDGFDGEIVWDTSKPNGQPRRKLDTTRAKELFGFEARTFREGIARTVAWYREHASAYAGR